MPAATHSRQGQALERSLTLLRVFLVASAAILLVAGLVLGAELSPARESVRPEIRFFTVKVRCESLGSSVLIRSVANAFFFGSVALVRAS